MNIENFIKESKEEMKQVNLIREGNTFWVDLLWDFKNYQHRLSQRTTDDLINCTNDAVHGFYRFFYKKASDFDPLEIRLWMNTFKQFVCKGEDLPISEMIEHTNKVVKAFQDCNSFRSPQA